MALDNPPKTRPPYVNNDWRLGEPGYTYALFYKRVEEPIKSASHEVCAIEPTVHDRWAFVRGDIDKMTKRESGNGEGLPLNTPTGPSNKPVGTSTASSSKRKRGIPAGGAARLPPKKGPRQD